MDKKHRQNPAKQPETDSLHISRQYAPINMNTDEKRMVDEAIHERLNRMAQSKERLNILLTNDFAFKKTFHNKKALKGLLSALLKIPVEEIETLEFPETILTGEFRLDREGILDVKVLLNNKKKINVEIQVKKFLFWEERSIFYNCKMFIDNFEKGMHYSKLETCIHISILNFNLSECDGLYSEIGLINAKNGNLYSDKFSFRVLYLNRINDASDEEKQTDIYKWARLISAKDWAELEQSAACNEYMKEACDEMEKINSNKTLRYNYLRKEMEESDRATLRFGGYLEGKAEGIAEGVVTGEARISRLNLKLLDAKQYSELEKASRDKSYRDELLERYGL